MRAAVLRSFCAVAVAVSAHAAGALAQSQTTATNQDKPSDVTVPPPPVSATTSPGAPVAPGQATVADIIVTAQRRSESLQKVPIAVTALSSAKLESAGIQNTLDLGRVTPGLTSVENSGASQPHVRGIGTTASAAGIEQAVATYIDGVYLAAAPASLLSLNNVDRIEVLKGPQGTLFGRNATGGLIQIVTKDPQNTPSGSLNLSYGNYDDSAVDLYATGGLASTLASAVALHYEHQGTGYGTNVATGKDTNKLDHDFATRIKFLFTPTSRTRIRLSADYENNASSRFVQSVGPGYIGQFNSGPYGGPFQQLSRKYDIDQNEDPIHRFKGGGVSLQINQDIGDLNLQSITAYRKSRDYLLFDADFTPQNIERLTIAQADNQFSEELQLSGRNSGRLKWVVGGFLFKSHARYVPVEISFLPSPLSPIPNTADDVTIRDTQTTTALAAYAQATYEILTDTHLTLGIRYSHEKKGINGNEVFSVNGFPVSNTPVPTPGLGIPSSVSQSKPTYRIAVDHQFGPHLLGYVSYNTGFKSGGYNLDFPANKPYKAETIRAYEVGLKSDLFSRRLRLNVAAFHYNYNNIQVGQFIAGQESIYNGASAELYGFDLDGEVVVGHGISLTGGFAYDHARFTSFPDANYVIPVNGCTPPLGGVCTASAAGKRLPYAPTATANIGIVYKASFGFGDVTFAADDFWSSRFYGGPDNAMFQSAYNLVNASLTWTQKGGRLSVKVYGKNLGSTVYATALVENGQGPTRAYGSPRTYGVTAGYRF